MNKILEQALDTLLTNAVEAQRGVMADENVNDSEKALNVIKAYLTPPTADEVCKALSEWVKSYKNYKDTFNSVIYVDEEKTFYIKKTYGLFQRIVMPNEYKNQGYIFDDFPLTPHLITLISRFYEGLEQ